LTAHFIKEEIKALVEKARSSITIKNESSTFIEFLGEKIELYNFQLFAYDNIDFQMNLKLAAMEKWPNSSIQIRFSKIIFNRNQDNK
jgi:hypothetical protein